MQAPLLDAATIAVGMPVAATAAPTQQSMMRQIADPSTTGIVYRERIYLSQVFCQACEKKTNFAVGSYPSNDGNDGHVNDPQILAYLRSAWLGEVREESTCLCRYCCHQNRELKLGFFSLSDLGVVGGTFAEGGFAGYGWPEGRVPELVLDRPFRCTLCCCCFLINPQEMSAEQEGRVVGRTVQQCKPCPCLCFPFEYFVYDEAEAHVYTVRAPACSDDGCRNCCAPTCFNAAFVAPITDAKSGAEVGSIENHWPGCNVRGICCAGMANNNFVIKFPAGATEHQKSAILSSAHLIDLNLFERRGNQK